MPTVPTRGTAEHLTAPLLARPDDGASSHSTDRGRIHPGARGWLASAGRLGEAQPGGQKDAVASPVARAEASRATCEATLRSRARTPPATATARPSGAHRCATRRSAPASPVTTRPAAPLQRWLGAQPSARVPPQTGRPRLSLAAVASPSSPPSHHCHRWFGRRGRWWGSPRARTAAVPARGDPGIATPTGGVRGCPRGPVRSRRGSSRT